MARTLNLEVERDHLVSLTRVSPLNALREVIWNSLDADATKINISYELDELDGIKKIIVKDNGHGISHEEAIQAFSSLGGSAKKTKKHSPNNRILHGEEGKGRFRIFALGGLITFISVYSDNGQKKSFRITLNNNRLKNPEVEDPKNVSSSQNTGVTVLIDNIEENISKSTFGLATKNKIAQRFAVYEEAYDFEIFINNEQLDFSTVVKNTYTKDFKVDYEGKEVAFSAKIIEWNFDSETDLFLCNPNGIAYQETNLGYKPSLPVTVYLLSEYIEELHKNSKLQLENLDEIVQGAKGQIREITRDYIRERKHKSSHEIIEKLKKEKLYPYEDEPNTPTEKAERQVFDIVTLEVHESSPDFDDQTPKSKKITLQLLKEALENERSDFKKILKEIVELPENKVTELSEILEKTSLTNLIDAMKEIQDRLRIVYELKELLFNPNYKDKVLERSHLHKILKNETWIFGDDYTYGADDVSLRNVLKEYINYLGRDELVEKIPGDEKLDKNIPDVCLWKQYNRGTSGHFKNLVIELKRPNKSITIQEIDQIKRYARVVHSDDRFPTEKTEWIFVLLSTKLNDDAELECNQADREWGLIELKPGLKVYVKKWGDILNEAEARHQYLKKKLGYEVKEEDEGIILLKKKYKEYLPDLVTKIGN
ncbi:MAG: ATP-binding protein [Gracilimonas sp.]